MKNGRSKSVRLLTMLLALGLLASTIGYAQQNDRRSPPERGEVFDNRHNHGRYYPQRGTRVRTLPPAYRPYSYRGNPYYFADGAWYRPHPRGFVIVRPPTGLFVSELPPYRTTVWAGGLPYYYADDTYYQWVPGMSTYTVVVPPAAAAPSRLPLTEPLERAVRGNLYTYPNNGQAPEQQAADRYECHTWAKEQTGFDPTAPMGGVMSEDNEPKSAAYDRAMSACFTARGYSVK